MADVGFGVPQGSIVGPVLFNLYVNNLEDCLQESCNCLQYADDTTIYQHSAPKNLNSCIQAMNENLQSIESWACTSNLLLNEKKTKQMLVTTPQMSRVHELGTLTPTLKLKDQILDRVDKFKLLGTRLGEDLKWTHHVNQVTS